MAQAVQLKVATLKIVYMSCHEVLEADELRLLTDLGYECYSLGAYTNPYGDEGRKRPGIPAMPYDPHWIELSTRYGKDNLHPEMLDGMDVVIVMHVPEWIKNNWPLFDQFIKRGGRVIWRSIGQSVSYIEQTMRMFVANGLEIVRYSPAERNIPAYAGENAMIRFAKDPDEYQGWGWGGGDVVNFTQSIAQRGTHCGWDVVSAMAERIPVKLYGPGNEGISFSGGLVSYEDQKRVYREAGVYLYTGTHPASYTLGFIEAWMTGTPVVAVGPIRGNPHGSGYAQDTYEVHDLIDHNLTGFIADDLGDMEGHIRDLLRDQGLAEDISRRARAEAVAQFGIKAIGAEWQAFIEGGRQG